MANQYKRERLRRMLRQAHYDPRVVSLMHRRLGVPDAWQGRSAEEWLDSLTDAELDTLLDKLKEDSDE